MTSFTMTSVLLMFVASIHATCSTLGLSGGDGFQQVVQTPTTTVFLAAPSPGSTPTPGVHVFLNGRAHVATGADVDAVVALGAHVSGENYVFVVQDRERSVFACFGNVLAEATTCQRLLTMPTAGRSALSSDGTALLIGADGSETASVLRLFSRGSAELPFDNNGSQSIYAAPGRWGRNGLFWMNSQPDTLVARDEEIVTIYDRVSNLGLSDHIYPSRSFSLRKRLDIDESLEFDPTSFLSPDDKLYVFSPSWPQEGMTVVDLKPGGTLEVIPGDADGRFEHFVEDVMVLFGGSPRVPVAFGRSSDNTVVSWNLMSGQSFDVQHNLAIFSGLTGVGTLIDPFKLQFSVIRERDGPQIVSVTVGMQKSDVRDMCMDLEISGFLPARVWTAGDTWMTIMTVSSLCLCSGVAVYMMLTRRPSPLFAQVLAPLLEAREDDAIVTKSAPINITPGDSPAFQSYEQPCEEPYKQPQDKDHVHTGH